MQDRAKTKEQLIIELHELRKRVAEVEKDKADCKQDEEALQLSNARITHLNDVLRAIRDVGSLINSEKDPTKLLSAVCDSLVQTRGYVIVWIGKPEADSNRVLPIAHSKGNWDFLQHAQITWDDSPSGQGPSGTAIRERRAVVFDDLATDPRFAIWKDPVVDYGGASIASVPLIYEERPLGVLTVKADRPHAFDLEEVELLKNLAADLARALQSLENEVVRERAEEELKKYRDRLEDMVKESTSELAMSNELLMREIDERKRIEVELQRAHDELERRVQERTAALAKANEELRQIPSKLIAVQEEERKRLAAELHDSIGQTLAAVKFWVEMALQLKDAGNGKAALNHLEQFVPILQRSIEETRNIYMGLRPTMLDREGLLITLEWLRQECVKLYPERHIELEARIAEEEIPESLKINIFRIAQEALNNIAKHSKAEWVDISLSKQVGKIHLVVSDDGVGMELDPVIQAINARSLGLITMRERAELTGGSFSIESSPGEGTTIRAFWPISPDH